MPLAHSRLSWLSLLFGLVWVLTCFVYNATKPAQPELSELFNFSTGHNVLSFGREPTLTNQKFEPPSPPPTVTTLTPGLSGLSWLLGVWGVFDYQPSRGCQGFQG